MLYGGIDVAKHPHTVCIVYEQGEVILRMPIPNNHRGLEKFLTALEGLRGEPTSVELCLEATGHYWLALYYHLTEAGYRVRVINPIQSDALRNLYVRKTKTDGKDALLLADLLRLGRAPETELASEEVLKLQTLSRRDSNLSDRSAASNSECWVSWTASSPSISSAFPASLYAPQRSFSSVILTRRSWPRWIYPNSALFWPSIHAVS